MLSSAHTFATCGTYPVALTVVDRYHRSRVLTTMAQVGDAPLTGHGLILRRSTGTIATFHDGNPLASPRQLSATVRWDGGPATGATIRPTGRGEFVVKAPRSPRGRGRHIAVVRVIDDCGAQATTRTILRNR